MIIRIAAALLTNASRTLVVRKHGTAAFMQPGGKIDPGETPLAALIRELEEELYLIIDPGSASHLGCFEAPAANEPDTTVVAELFHVRVSGEIKPGAEIAEAVWIEANADHGLKLAALTRECVLPLFVAMRSAT